MVVVNPEDVVAVVVGDGESVDLQEVEGLVGGHLGIGSDDVQQPS